jgi:hypothetical protein
MSQRTSCLDLIFKAMKSPLSMVAKISPGTAEEPRNRPAEYYA